jgi:hypothetical protein
MAMRTAGLRRPITTSDGPTPAAMYDECIEKSSTMCAAQFANGPRRCATSPPARQRNSLASVAWIAW